MVGIHVPNRDEMKTGERIREGDVGGERDRGKG